MQILGLLGMYFDAAVVFVTSTHFYSNWLWPYCGSIPRIVLYVEMKLNWKSSVKGEAKSDKMGSLAKLGRPIILWFLPIFLQFS